jgi:DNA-binding transcriptional ArsR family regulator
MRTLSRSRPASGLASVLFGKSMRAILALLYGRPEQRFYVREIARAAGTPPSSLQRDLAALAAVGIVEREENGRQVYYRANLSCPIFSELKSIVTKTFGVADFLRDLLRPHERHIRAAFIYGSVAKGTEASGSDVDVFVIGDLPPSGLAVELGRINLDLGRRVSLVSYSVEEFTELSMQANPFVTRILQGPVIWLIGDKETVDALRPQQPRKPRTRKAA